MARLLLVDDDLDLLEVTAYALRREGFQVAITTDGRQALRWWESAGPDLVLLDVGQPRPNGIEVCRKIKAAAPTPVILMGTYSDDDHVIAAFRAGADDYVEKPYSCKQLALRIHAILRRTARGHDVAPSNLLRVGPLTLDAESCQVAKGEESAQLTKTEFRILHLLAQNGGQVVSFDRLSRHVWGDEESGSEVITCHVAHIRRKLRIISGDPAAIRAVPRVGYSLTAS
jgi:DNA-binding response OmpR family regulator